jgi:2'-deoxycytidine 5'-triphosphate deaminase (DCD)
MTGFRSIGLLVYEPLTEIPTQVYGQGIGSPYQKQGLALSKHLRPYDLSTRWLEFPSFRRTPDSRSG